MVHVRLVRHRFRWFEQFALDQDAFEKVRRNEARTKDDVVAFSSSGGNIRS